jgi:two-component system C4-dicarboxylate transport response regulator DctD
VVVNDHPAHHVLVVDDNDDARETLGRALVGFGFTVHTAWSAEDALRQFRQGVLPCIVVLDLRMPGMDGWALWDRMRIDPRLGRIPVIMISGYPEEERFARERAVPEFFVKPAPLDALTAAIDRYCGQRL